MCSLFLFCNFAGETAIEVSGLLCTAVALAAVLVVAWGVRAFLERRLFPRHRPWVVTWTGWELLLLVFLIQIVWPVLVNQALHYSGCMDSRYPPQSVAANVIEGAEAANEKTGDAALRRSREALWLYAAMFPFQVSTIVGVLWIMSRTRPQQLGLTTRDLSQNVAIGFLGWLLFAPPVFILNLIVNLLYRWVFHVQEEEHPLTRL